MIQMTPRNALEIQERHIKHYGSLYPGGEEALRAAVQAKTNLDGLDLDEEYDVILINQRIPRGGAIESMCGVDFGGN